MISGMESNKSRNACNKNLHQPPPRYRTVSGGPSIKPIIIMNANQK